MSDLRGDRRGIIRDSWSVFASPLIEFVDMVWCFLFSFLFFSFLFKVLQLVFSIIDDHWHIQREREGGGERVECSEL